MLRRRASCAMRIGSVDIRFTGFSIKFLFLSFLGSLLSEQMKLYLLGKTLLAEYRTTLARTRGFGLIAVDLKSISLSYRTYTLEALDISLAWCFLLRVSLFAQNVDGVALCHCPPELSPPALFIDHPDGVTPSPDPSWPTYDPLTVTTPPSLNPVASDMAVDVKARLVARQISAMRDSSGIHAAVAAVGVAVGDAPDECAVTLPDEGWTPDDVTSTRGQLLSAVSVGLGPVTVGAVDAFIDTPTALRLLAIAKELKGLRRPKQVGSDTTSSETAAEPSSVPQFMIDSGAVTLAFHPESPIRLKATRLAGLTFDAASVAMGPTLVAKTGPGAIDTIPFDLPELERNIGRLPPPPRADETSLDDDPVPCPEPVQAKGVDRFVTFHTASAELDAPVNPKPGHLFDAWMTGFIQFNKLRRRAAESDSDTTFLRLRIQADQMTGRLRMTPFESKLHRIHRLGVTLSEARALQLRLLEDDERFKAAPADRQRALLDKLHVKHAKQWLGAVGASNISDPTPQALCDTETGRCALFILEDGTTAEWRAAEAAAREAKNVQFKADGVTGLVLAGEIEAWRVTALDYPVPLYKARMTKFTADMLVAGTGTVLGRYIHQRPYPVAPGQTLFRPRPTAPSKLYHITQVYADRPVFAYPAAYMPVWAAIRAHVGAITGPSRSTYLPVNWYDKLRANLHGRLDLVATEAIWLLSPHRDPYRVTEDALTAAMGQAEVCIPDCRRMLFRTHQLRWARGWYAGPTTSSPVTVTEIRWDFRAPRVDHHLWTDSAVDPTDPYKPLRAESVEFDVVVRGSADVGPLALTDCGPARLLYTSVAGRPISRPVELPLPSETDIVWPGVSGIPLYPAKPLWMLGPADARWFIFHFILRYFNPPKHLAAINREARDVKPYGLSFGRIFRSLVVRISSPSMAMGLRSPVPESNDIALVRAEDVAFEVGWHIAPSMRQTEAGPVYSSAWSLVRMAADCSRLALIPTSTTSMAGRMPLSCESWMPGVHIDPSHPVSLFLDGARPVDALETRRVSFLWHGAVAPMDPNPRPLDSPWTRPTHGLRAQSVKEHMAGRHPGLAVPVAERCLIYLAVDGCLGEFAGLEALYWAWKGVMHGRPAPAAGPVPALESPRGLNLLLSRRTGVGYKRRTHVTPQAMMTVVMSQTRVRVSHDITLMSQGTVVRVFRPTSDTGYAFHVDGDGHGTIGTIPDLSMPAVNGRFHIETAQNKRGMDAGRLEVTMAFPAVSVRANRRQFSRIMAFTAGILTPPPDAEVRRTAARKDFYTAFLHSTPGLDDTELPRIQARLTRTLAKLKELPPAPSKAKRVAQIESQLKTLRRLAELKKESVVDEGVVIKYRVDCLEVTLADAGEDTPVVSASLDLLSGTVRRHDGAFDVRVSVHDINATSLDEAMNCGFRDIVERDWERQAKMQGYGQDVVTVAAVRLPPTILAGIPLYSLLDVAVSPLIVRVSQDVLDFISSFLLTDDDAPPRPPRRVRSQSVFSTTPKTPRTKRSNSAPFVLSPMKAPHAISHDTPRAHAPTPTVDVSNTRSKEAQEMLSRASSVRSVGVLRISSIPVRLTYKGGAMASTTDARFKVAALDDSEFLGTWGELYRKYKVHVALSVLNQAPKKLASATIRSLLGRN
ncbi:Golgi-body localization protein domain [Carpediemonas membranifera]|uniref:Golgi-body localization protein domain n=1 Tax=Carpediemonas membranifera TaxID=201153 RepID=A0A8J6B448_9EUKA|nr:Golgi-body localization protein domain [Carpediemonas membranifera]|eukprot:KAG9389637.1 Golgi-body localization protein domain [Carpediemonas membranifera]